MTVAGLPQGLPLFAFDGSPIPNSIDADPSDGYVALARDGFRFAINAATQLRGPTGRYNCHGLVFASRRTNIPPPNIDYSIDDLLNHDGYRRVSRAPRVGDVAVYRNDKGSIEHTGIVCNADPGMLTPRIWSMWGGLGEFVHAPSATPYGQAVEYWALP